MNARRAVALLTLVPLLAAGRPASAQQDTGPVGLFDARAVGSVVDYTFHVPDAVFPFEVFGGILQSTSVATSSPRGFGMAGIAPVPVLTSAGLIIPGTTPIGTPVPEEVQEAFKSIDYSSLPNGCQSSYPPAQEGGDEVTCGGPDQDDPGLAFTAAGLNGHSHSSGDLDDPYATRTEARSRAADLTLPGLQARLRQAYSASTTALNDLGVPQGEAVAEIDAATLLGRLITLEGVRSHTIVATDGTEEGTAARSTFTIRSVTVAGVPVRLDAGGVTVDDQQIPAPAVPELDRQVREAMAEAGDLRLRLVPAPEPVVSGGEVTARSAALEVAYTTTAPTPARVVYRLLATDATVNAIASYSADPDSMVGDDIPDAASTDPAGDGAAAGASAGTGAGRAPARGGSVPPATLPSRAPDAPPAAGQGIPSLAYPPAAAPPAPPPRASAPGPASSPAVPSGIAAPTAGQGTTGDTGTGDAATSEVATGPQALLRPVSLSTELPAGRLRLLYAAAAVVALAGAGATRLFRLPLVQPRTAKP